MSDLLADSPVTHLVPEGRHGRPHGAPGVRARVVDDLALASLAARKDAAPALGAAIRGAFGIDLPTGPKMAAGAEISLIGTAPGRWLVLKDAARGADLLARLTSVCGATAALTDQSDANLVLELSGPQVGGVLEKLVALDLHPDVFRPGESAATMVALMSVLFWRLPDAEGGARYRFAVPRSFGPAFVRALTAAAAPFGFDLAGTGTAGAPAGTHGRG